MIEKDVFSGLKNIIGNVYPIMMPDDAIFPCATYLVVFDGQAQAHNGNLIGRDVRFQVDIYSKSYSEAKTLKENVVAKVVELKGGNISAQDLYEDELKLHRQLIDFTIKRR